MLDVGANHFHDNLFGLFVVELVVDKYGTDQALEDVS
jgi:hypothetical protein